MRLFYDHLIDKTKLVKLIEEKGKDFEKKIGLHKVLDEIIHAAVLDVIFSHLDKNHHKEFLVLMHKNPRSAELLVYLKLKAHPQIEDKIREKIGDLRDKILKEI